jgi:hypothetical protein
LVLIAPTADDDQCLSCDSLFVDRARPYAAHPRDCHHAGAYQSRAGDVHRAGARSKSVTAILDARSVLTFCSAEASRNAALAIHALNETEETPQLLN